MKWSEGRENVILPKCCNLKCEQKFCSNNSTKRRHKKSNFRAEDFFSFFSKDTQFYFDVIQNIFGRCLYRSSFVLSFTASFFRK